MNVASLELCKELYAVSGWKGHIWSEDGVKSCNLFFNSMAGWTLTTCADPKAFEDEPDDWIPAYDLGYLLQKLPGENMAFAHGKNDTWYLNLILMDIRGPGMQSSFSTEGVSIEDAVAKLAIELFKQKVLTHE